MLLASDGKADSLSTRWRRMSAPGWGVLENPRRQCAAVMCAESLWWRCHRRLAGGAPVLAGDAAVRHPRRGGRLAARRRAEGARLAGERETIQVVYGMGPLRSTERRERRHMETAAFLRISHLDLSVSDVEASASWYERVLGLRRLRRAEYPKRTMIVLLHQASGLVIGLNQHQGSPGEPFDERRAGLDHVGFAVEARKELQAWQARLAALGVEHSPVADTEAGSALVFRDPDHIQLELWWSKPDVTTAATSGAGLIERSSPDGVAETVRRLAEAAAASGVTVFATIDHAAGARSAGLEMPETQVVLLGNPLAGTPVMLAAPDLALDLPTRVLIRQPPPGIPGSRVVFHDPEDTARSHALTPGQAGGLQGIIALVDRALKDDPHGLWDYAAGN